MSKRYDILAWMESKIGELSYFRHIEIGDPEFWNPPKMPACYIDPDPEETVPGTDDKIQKEFTFTVTVVNEKAKDKYKELDAMMDKIEAIIEIDPSLGGIARQSKVGTLEWLFATKPQSRIIAAVPVWVEYNRARHATLPM